MIQGMYRDQIYDGQSQLRLDRDWSPNTIVDLVWPLIAGLLKNDPDLSGMLYLAVGSGEPAWDGTGLTASPTATQLQNEIGRQELSASDIIYLDPDDNPSQVPTHCLQITANLRWPNQAQTLREFGVFGGNAAAAANSGALINYVIHPSVELEAGSTLRRRIKLSLRPRAIRDWIELPRHWLRDIPVVELDGVGNAHVASLTAVGITAIGELADLDPRAVTTDIALTTLVELRAKARLALRTAADLVPIPELFDLTAWDIMVTPAETLAAQTGIMPAAVRVVQEKISVLQLALDNRFLRGLSMRELVQAP